MTATAAKYMNAAEFLAWAELQEKGRYELLRGEIVAMAPERAQHVTAKYKICRALSDAIASVRAPCEAFVDGLGVAIDGDTIYEPDALVNCGEKVAADSLLAPSPTIVVEVISPSSRNIDKTIKLADYFRLPSVAHYLIIDIGRRLVFHYHRQDGQIIVSIVKEGAIALDPPGIAVEIADIFP